MEIINSFTDFEFFSLWIIAVLLMIVLEQGLKIRGLKRTIGFLLPTRRQKDDEIPRF